ncbi:NADH dehydrogenase [ubiquinone] flavoprotein 2, mitochondrial, partial [Geodia barretti]
AFAFTPENQANADAVIAKYPAGCQASAVLPLLDLAQRQNGGWISQAVMEYVAALLDMASIRVYEVATFYTMLNLEPVGRYHVQLCRTTPCWLRGSDALRDACRDELGIGLGETTEDGHFTLTEVECLGACVNAPMVQINDHFYEDLDPARMKDILRAFKAGDPSTPGPQTGRQTSAPASGPTTLTEL